MKWCLCITRASGVVNSGSVINVLSDSAGGLQGLRRGHRSGALMPCFIVTAESLLGTFLRRCGFLFYLFTIEKQHSRSSTYKKIFC
jgi:hypothetical protein